MMFLYLKTLINKGLKEYIVLEIAIKAVPHTSSPLGARAIHVNIRRWTTP